MSQGISEGQTIGVTPRVHILELQLFEVCPITYNSEVNKISFSLFFIAIGLFSLTGCTDSSNSVQDSTTPSASPSSSNSLEWANGPSAATNATAKFDDVREWSDGWRMSVSTPKLTQALGQPERFRNDHSSAEWDSLDKEQYLLITVTITNNTGSEARLSPWNSPVVETAEGPGAAVNFVNSSGQTIAYSGTSNSNNEIFSQGGFKIYTYYYTVNGDPGTLRVTGSPTEDYSEMTWSF